jgi:hypothetical protein
MRSISYLKEVRNNYDFYIRVIFYSIKEGLVEYWAKSHNATGPSFISFTLRNDVPIIWLSQNQSDNKTCFTFLP